LGKLLNPAVEPPASPEDLGLHLRLAREACRLSIPSAAASLHLPPRVITALEASDFAQFEPVYVRGYLRNYARLLNLEADPLIESYNRTQVASHPVAPPDVEPPRSEFSVRSLLLPLALVALPLLLWGAGQALHLFDAAKPPPVQGEIAIPSQSVEAPPPSVPAQLPEPKLVQPSARDIEPPVAAAPKPKPAEAVPALSQAAGHDAAQSSPVAPAANPGSAAPPVLGAGPDSVAIRLSASGWVSISDQSGHRLVYENLPAGAERRLAGQAPFAVVLGNSPATQIEFNGQPFTQPKSKAGTVARFKLGQPGREGDGNAPGKHSP
jgi:cytoskeleton protein RodZ